MKRAIMIGLLLAGTVAAQMTPGQAWKAFSLAERNAYIIGYVHGCETLAAIVSSLRGVTVSADRITQLTCPRRALWGPVDSPSFPGVGEMDRFYADFANTNIPLPEALGAIINRLTGTPDAEVQKAIEADRARYGLPPLPTTNAVQSQ